MKTTVTIFDNASVFRAATTRQYRYISGAIALYIGAGHYLVEPLIRIAPVKQRGKGRSGLARYKFQISYTTSLERVSARISFGIIKRWDHSQRRYPNEPSSDRLRWYQMGPSESRQGAHLHSSALIEVVAKFPWVLSIKARRMVLYRPCLCWNVYRYLPCEDVWLRGSALLPLSQWPTRGGRVEFIPGPPHRPSDW